YVEASGRNQEPARRFTTADGLASNIVTHLAVANGTVWAACVDIYDPVRKIWGPGGLCKLDARTGRWERVQQIDGQPVRWVTLLQAIGNELWVGYREGEGILGDRIVYSMGLYPDEYRPRASKLVLSRLQNGRWTRFVRV